MKRIKFVPNQNLTGDLYWLQNPRTDAVKPEIILYYILFLKKLRIGGLNNSRGWVTGPAQSYIK